MLTSGAFGYLADYVLWWLLYLSLLVHAWCFFRFFPSARHPKSGLIMGNVLVLACLLGAVALAGESYLRFAAVDTDAFGVSLPARRWFALHTQLNALGCRDVEWTMEKPVGVRRIAFVGDSFTYGWGIKRVEDRFPDSLAARFERRLPGRVEVMNVAKPGWGTGDQIQPVTDMIALYDVDEVVLCYVPNDIEKLLPTTDDFDPTRPPEPRLFNPDSSCLVDFLFRRLYVPYAATVHGYHDWLAEGYADASIWRRQQEQLYALVRVCRDEGAVFRVVLMPFLRTSGKKFDPETLHATLARFFETNDTPVIDLWPTVAGKDRAALMVSAHDAHPNEKAQQLFSEAIWQAFYANEEP